METETLALKTDVLIVGAGFAGCRAAIQAHDLGAQVLVVTDGPFGATGSSFHPIRLSWGRGYTAGLGVSGAADTPEAHYADIVRAGQGLTDRRLAEIVAQDAPARYRDLEGYGVEFTLMSRLMKMDVNDHGHGTRGALAMNPPNLRATFRRQVEQRGIAVCDRTRVVALLGERGRCDGALVADGDGRLTVIHAKAIVLATGGPDDLFRDNLNTPDLTGTCHAMALDLGAQLVNIEFSQIILGMTRHPHAPFAEALLSLHPQIRNVRGDALFGDAPEVLDTRAQTGPFSWNSRGAAFDLALARELYSGGRVTVDFRGIDSLDVPQTIANRWRAWAQANGVDFGRPIEIAPCIHACNGGIRIDENGGTGVAYLFACGEVTGGMHGANRIGGNQFASTQVFGVRSAQAAVAAARDSTWRMSPDASGRVIESVAHMQERDRSGTPAMVIRRRLQDAMWRYVTLDRSAANLRTAQAVLRELDGLLPEVTAHSPGEFGIALGLPDAVRMAGMIVAAALMRAESRGPHWRTDHAFQDDEHFRNPIVVAAADAPCGFAGQWATDTGWV